MDSAPPSPHRVRPRPWRTSQRVVVLGTMTAFGLLGLVCLLAGVESVVRARQGTADLWLEAAAVTAPDVLDLGPGLSSQGYDHVHLGVAGAHPSSMVLYALTLALGSTVAAGICGFLAYVCYRIYIRRPFGRILTVGLTACSAALVGLSLLGPLLFAAAQERILADLGVELGRAPFVNDYSFGGTDGIVLVAGVFLGLLALAFRAGSWIQREGLDPQ
ncbi:hypothetical protein ACH9DO_07545 [Kocuria sp. M1N1S27]|uniref:hypothetical protein n=1 Tax=Kocuria kalidii TaxID=3376283 RepID=UPI0037946E47